MELIPVHRFGVTAILYIYFLYISVYGWIQVTRSVILSNVIPLNNLLLNSYFKNSIVGLHV